MTPNNVGEKPPDNLETHTDDEPKHIGIRIVENLAQKRRADQNSTMFSAR
jgi:hypothetical protein